MSVNQKIQAEHPGTTTILWDYKSAYYSWGILDSAGGYVFAKNGSNYDLDNVGAALQIATDGRASAQTSLRDAEANMRRR